MPTHLEALQLLDQAKRRRTFSREGVEAATADVARAETREAAANKHLARFDAMHESFILTGAAASTRGAHDNAVGQVVACQIGRVRANIEVTICRTRAITSRAKQLAARKALEDAEAAVVDAAQLALDAEMIRIAEQVHAAMDLALAHGELLQGIAIRDELNVPLNQHVPVLPRIVEEALARLPVANPFDLPVNVLRGSNTDCDAWTKRLALLIGDAQMISA